MIVLTIAGREVRAIFSTVVGWVVLAAFALMAGAFWSWALDAYYAASTASAEVAYRGPGLDLAEHLVAPYFGNIAFVLLFLCPGISMRLFAEEYKQGTMELLLTSPISTAQIVAGKFLGALAFVAVMLACTAYVPITLMLWGDPDPAAFVGGYVALLLVGGSTLAFGSLFSAVTENQIVALIPSFALVLLIGLLAVFDLDRTSWSAQLSMLGHATDLMRGLVKLSDLVYFAGFTGVFLLATHQRVESLRWR